MVKRKTKKPKEPVWREPVWKGPEVDGITQSLLSRFLVCRERFRLLVVEGLRPVDTFNHRIEYGQMWHVCEESLAKQPKSWNFRSLQDYCKGLMCQYPTQQEQIEHWYLVCKVQFPLYVKYWQKHPDVKNRTPLLQEQVFDVPYKLPSERVVRLRGKWDSVDLIGKGKVAGIYLQENKTKGDVNEDQMKRQLQFDLQTMIYLIALSRTMGRGPMKGCKKLLGGVRYNVIRRPLSGGKGSIRQHQPSKSNPQGETKEHFYGRVADIIAEEPSHFFMRWKVEVTPADLERFQWECLNPILEQLCDWWEWISGTWARRVSPFDNEIHWRHPFGVYNILNEGRASEMDEYLATGSELGLERTKTLFGELE